MYCIAIEVYLGLVDYNTLNSAFDMLWKKAYDKENKETKKSSVIKTAIYSKGQWLTYFASTEINPIVTIFTGITGNKR